MLRPPNNSHPEDLQPSYFSSQLIFDFPSEFEEHIFLPSQ